MCKLVINTCESCGSETTRYSFCSLWQEGKMCVSTMNSRVQYRITGSRRDRVVENRTLTVPMTPDHTHCNYTISIQDLLETVFVDDLCKKCIITINRNSKRRSDDEYD